MTPKLTFFDTNIILYTDDRKAPAKQLLATELVGEHMRSGSLTISLQVVQEYYAAATRKLGVPPEVAQKKVQLLTKARVVRITESDVVSAIELHRLNQISFWDAMIVHAARQAGAETLFTEDLQHGGTIGGVRIHNPFLRK